jgi:IclR family transcriptional regulator, KDG regulon repressor
MGVTELARRTDLFPSDVHRILASLASYGFVEQNPTNKTYRLGMSLMKLGLTVFQRNELREAARPLLQRLSETMDATAHMAMFDPRELDIFLVEQIDRTTDLRFKPKFGGPASPHSTALGKAIMANIDRSTAMQLLDKTGMPRATLHTITRMAELEPELTRINRQGYAVDLEESVEGACCIGAPVRDWTGAAVAAISVSMAATRFYEQQESQLASAVKTAAAELSAAMGGRRPSDGGFLSIAASAGALVHHQ